MIPTMKLYTKKGETLESPLTDQEAAEACDRIPEDHKNAKFAYRITHQRTCLIRAAALRLPRRRKRVAIRHLWGGGVRGDGG